VAPEYGSIISSVVYVLFSLGFSSLPVSKVYQFAVDLHCLSYLIHFLLLLTTVLHTHTHSLTHTHAHPLSLSLSLSLSFDALSIIISYPPPLLARSTCSLPLFVLFCSFQYVPVANDLVVGTVVEKHGDGYKMDVGGSHLALLPALAFEGATKRSKPNLAVSLACFHILCLWLVPFLL
jgi:Exosome complex component RRP40, S1 domain